MGLYHHLTSLEHKGKPKHIPGRTSLQPVGVSTSHATHKAFKSSHALKLQLSCCLPYQFGFFSMILLLLQ